MGTYAYIFVAALVIIGGLTAVAMKSDTRSETHSLAGAQFKEEAREAALAGMNLTIRQIATHMGPWIGADAYSIPETEYRRATYETTVSVYGLGDTLDIISVGTKDVIARTGAVEDTTHTIEARLVRVDLVGGIPPGFEVAILTDKDMRIQGTFEVHSLDPELNADIHANGLLETRGNSFLVEGFGTYTDAARIRNEDNFLPNHDFNGAGVANIIQQDSIQIPPIDVAAFRTESQTHGVYNAGDVNVDQAYLNSLAGTQVTSFADLAAALNLPQGTGASAEQPLIFFSENTIDFVDDLTLDGYGAFVSAGSIHINSNVNITGEIGTGPSGFPTTKMGIFTAGEGDINGGANIQATVYINGAVKFNGDAEITGGAVMRDIAKMNGSFIITWVGPNEGLVKNFGGWRDVEGPVIAAWAEW